MPPRLRARSSVALALVLAAVSLAGCGGDDGPDGPDRRSRAAFTRRADAICAAGAAEADRLRAEAVPGARGRAAAREIDATLEALHVQVDGFEDLRGPPATDDDLDALVEHLRDAAAGLGELRDRTVDGDLTVDEAIAANPAIVRRVNRASAAATDALVALDLLACIGVAVPDE